MFPFDVNIFWMEFLMFGHLICYVYAFKWKESDGQQSRLHQQNELSPLILNKDHVDVGNPISGLGQAIQIDIFVTFTLNEATTFCFYNIAHKYVFPLKEKNSFSFMCLLQVIYNTA